MLLLKDSPFNIAVLGLLCIVLQMFYTMFRYGQKHGYPHLEHVTLPRIGVTQTILEELSEEKEDLLAETSHRTTLSGMQHSVVVIVVGILIFCT